MAFYNFDRRIIDPSTKPWGYPLPAYLYDPVILLAVPNAPTVTASTGVISETPVGDSVELSLPAVPSISVGTSVNENP